MHFLCQSHVVVCISHISCRHSRFSSAIFVTCCSSPTRSSPWRSPTASEWRCGPSDAPRGAPQATRAATDSLPRRRQLEPAHLPIGKCDIHVRWLTDECPAYRFWAPAPTRRVLPLWRNSLLHSPQRLPTHSTSAADCWGGFHAAPLSPSPPPPLSPPPSRARSLARSLLSHFLSHSCPSGRAAGAPRERQAGVFTAGAAAASGESE